MGGKTGENQKPGPCSHSLEYKVGSMSVFPRVSRVSVTCFEYDFINESWRPSAEKQLLRESRSLRKESTCRKDRQCSLNYSEMQSNEYNSLRLKTLTSQLIELLRMLQVFLSEQMSEYVSVVLLEPLPMSTKMSKHMSRSMI